MAKPPPLGIDLGTINSSAAVFKDGKTEIIFSRNEGKNTTPSVVSFTANECFVGEAAKKMIVLKPKDTVYEIKRIIGRPFHNEVVKTCKKRWHFEVINTSMKPSIRIEAEGKVKILTPEEITSKVLDEIKKSAEAYLGCEVTEVVITVPARFNDSQRQATVDAASLAGLNVLTLISEPTAAAIAYRLDNDSKETRNVLVYDFGGGTFDVSILKVTEKHFNVLATNGDTFLGGSDIDAKLVEYFHKQFKEQHPGGNLNEKELRRIVQQCEKLKMKLSKSVSGKLDINNIGDYDFQSEITREKLNDLCRDIFDRTIECITKAIESSKLTVDDIDNVILVGGSSKIPKVQELLKDMFRGKILKESSGTDEAVARGAAIHAAVIQNDINARDVMISDVLPLSIGIENHLGEFCIIIKRNLTIPCEETVQLSTWKDDQTALKFNLYEGEHEQAKKNTLLGKLEFRDLEAKKAGDIKFQLILAVDSDGILTAEAARADIEGTAPVKLTIELKKGRLTAAEIETKIVEMKKIRQMSAEDVAKETAKAELESLCAKLIRKLNAGHRQHVKYDQFADVCNRVMKQLDNENTLTNIELEYANIKEIYKEIGEDGCE